MKNSLVIVIVITTICMVLAIGSHFAFTADTVTTRVIKNGRFQYFVHFTNTSDGTGENNVVKVDKSTLIDSLGDEPSSLDIEQVSWAIKGFTSVRISWDHTTDDRALVLSEGIGHLDFRGWTDGRSTPDILGQFGDLRLTDPRSAGGTGDILFTAVDASSGDNYDITLVLYKSPN